MVESREYLDLAIRSLQIADHLTYVTYPLIKDNKLLLKVLLEMNKCIVNYISFVIEGGDWNEKFRGFLKNNDVDGFLNNEEIKKVKEILDLGKGYGRSAIEFSRGDKVVMMSDDLNVQVLDVERIKDYLRVVKKLIQEKMELSYKK
ncbi:hypothetical protein HOE04_01725 [archaeon]|jgi:hypothetical protein|nr:hypothetical protein [archaeon]